MEVVGIVMVTLAVGLMLLNLALAAKVQGGLRRSNELYQHSLQKYQQAKKIVQEAQKEHARTLHNLGL